MTLSGKFNAGLYEFAQDFLTGILRTASDPSGARCAPPQLCIKQLYAVEDGYSC